MKRAYDKREIAQLLSNFMAGETSVAEEQVLAQYFRTHEVGEEWAEYKEMFALFDSGEVDIELENEMSDKLTDGDSGKIRMLPKTVREKPKIVALRWLVVGLAASVLLLLTFYTQHSEQPGLTVQSTSRTKDMSVWQFEDEQIGLDAYIAHQKEIQEKGERLAAYIQQQITINIEK